MPLRQIIRIDESRCNGCGACIIGCPEGALQLVGGKAQLVREDYCDGLGACLGKCPVDAILVETREALAFDEAAVAAHAPPHEVQSAAAADLPPARGCPSAEPVQWGPEAAPSAVTSAVDASVHEASNPAATSELRQWPVQLSLVPPGAAFLKNADLLLAADCAPLSMPDFHARLLKGRVVVIACPKLDDRDAQTAKLAAIVREARPRSITIVHMQVPCCGGLNAMVRHVAGGAEVPVREVTVSLQGKIVAHENWSPAATPSLKVL